MGGRVGGQSRCERRIEVFVKFFWGRGRGGGGVRVDVNEELKGVQSGGSECMCK